MNERADQGLEMIDLSGGNAPGSDGQGVLQLLQDRMHGRWRWAISAGLVLGLSAAVAGYRMAGVKYSARGLVQVESDLPTLISDTPETERLENFGSYLTSQAELMRDSRVIADALKSDVLEPYLPALGEDPMLEISQSLSVGVVRGTNLIEVRYESEDRRLAQAATNAVIESYFRIYGPNSETFHTRTLQQVRTLLSDTRRQLADLESQRERQMRNSTLGSLESTSAVDALVTRILELQVQAESLQEAREKIEAVATAENRSVQPSDTVPYSDAELLERDSTIADRRAQLDQLQESFDALAARLGPEHPGLRIRQRELDLSRESLAAAVASAKEKWAEVVGEAGSYAGLTKQLDSVNESLTKFREQIGRLQQERLRVASIDREIEQVNQSIAVYELRIQGLETESASIRKGRITITSLASLPTSPSRDRRIQYGVAGLVGGFAASLCAFFLLGTVDRRAFASRQLESDKARYRPLGVIPDMSRLDDSDEQRLLLEDCVHRIRNRIEVRRPHTDRGFAVHISSPLQGDGKTSVAASLAWSYAQAGYRTLMIDADFIGRALSHQFGMLHETGVRAAMRDPDRTLEFIRPARPNLDLLPSGGDRAVSAGHLQPAAMRRLIDLVRDHYEIIVVDSGPLTASVESLPLIGAVDGVVLVLRRGRNRGQLAACIDDIRHVGTLYLGVILNYATLDDCQRYSSLSRFSSEAVDGDRSQGPAHPVVSVLGTRRSDEKAGT